MYVQPNLRNSLTEERYLKVVAKTIVTLVKDLRECGCVDAKIIQGMVDKVLEEEGLQALDKRRVVYRVDELIKDECPKFIKLMHRVTRI